MVDGAFFGMPDHFRIALGVKPKRFARGLERLGAALDELRKGETSTEVAAVV